MTEIPHADPREITIHREGAQRMGFFTDTTVCIGCKACEVACKQWNDLPSDGAVFRKRGSYDHTGSLSATSWRHVRFIELLEPSEIARAEAERALAAGGGGHVPAIPLVNENGELDLVATAVGEEEPARLVDIAAAAGAMDRWVFMSDVCKHCTHAGCMDACPTGALIRTEFETVILQPDVCNGCGYCVPSCPFGVVDRSPHDGRASKCTLCYDRLEDGLEPACAKACPTDSIQFGPLEELTDVAQRRVLTLHDRGLDTAYLYGAGDQPQDALAGGLGAFFLLTEPPERYGLPANAESPIQANVVPATVAAMTAACGAAVSVIALLGFSRGRGRRGAGALTAVAIGAAAYEAGRGLLARRSGD